MNRLSLLAVGGCLLLASSPVLAQSGGGRGGGGSGGGGSGGGGSGLGSSSNAFGADISNGFGSNSQSGFGNLDQFGQTTGMNALSSGIGSPATGLGLPPLTNGGGSNTS